MNFVFHFIIGNYATLVVMANEHTKNGTLDNKGHIRLAEQVLAKLEYPIDPNTIVGDLRVGQQQMVEIARNLVQAGLRILIMDEPTSSLSSQEVEVLFKIINELKASGISIVYISHRLEEITINHCWEGERCKTDTPDAPTIAGNSQEVFAYYGLTKENLIKTALEMLA